MSTAYIQNTQTFKHGIKILCIVLHNTIPRLCSTAFFSYSPDSGHFPPKSYIDSYPFLW